MVYFWSFFLSKIKFESDSMGWIQIFDQLVAFSESANEPILEALDHNFNFWTKWFGIRTFNRYHDTLCEGINSIKYILHLRHIDLQKLIKSTETYLSW